VAIHDTFVNMLQGVGGTPGHPIGGICDAGLSFVAAAHLAIGPLHGCGPMPPNPFPFLSATQHLANQLSAAVLAQTTTMQSLFGTTALTAQQFQRFDPASVPAPGRASSSSTPSCGRSSTVPARYRPTWSCRLRAHLPVSVVACEEEHCSIDVQAVLTVAGEQTPLPGQQLRLDSGEKAIVRVELTHDQLAALHAHGGGRLAVTIGSDGHPRTLHVRLTA
jgi:hypothetical protein